MTTKEELIDTERLANGGRGTVAVADGQASGGRLNASSARRSCSTVSNVSTQSSCSLSVRMKRSVRSEGALG